MHGGGKTRNSNGIFVYAIFRFYKNYIPSDSQGTSLQMYTHTFLVKAVKTSSHYKSESSALPPRCNAKVDFFSRVS